MQAKWTPFRALSFSTLTEFVTFQFSLKYFFGTLMASFESTALSAQEWGFSRCFMDFKDLSLTDCVVWLGHSLQESLEKIHSIWSNSRYYVRAMLRLQGICFVAESS